MEVFFSPHTHTTPVKTLRRQAAMRHHSSSSGQQGAVAQHGGRSSPERRNNDHHGHPDLTLHCEVKGNLSALDYRAPVNLEELGALDVTGLQVPSEDGPKGSCEDLMEALCSPAGGIAAALRSVASCNTWIKGPHVPLSVPQLFSCGHRDGETGAQTQAAGALSLQITPHREDPGGQGDAEATEREDGREESVIPQSKYIHILPLYQD
ncbi:hypothetical protein SKAU_G00172700 [Synaphobranchus kaupii]|uniref:Uncharacterized protein n=1 Tax=Synaphobranchus kaupii TaxID=118154 RepID=A0A9Q1FKQ9_SYNKA|nr:hypothetical protein SKAU_G00172700 [Synaphobranchus kaupii]